MREIHANINFSRRPKLPIVYASEAAECGLACLAMIGRFHGHIIDINALRKRFDISSRGMDLSMIIDIADQLQLNGRAVKFDLDQLHRVQLPAIFHWNFDHFVVVKKIQKGNIIIHDPSRGKRIVPLKTATKHLTGVALELSPTKTFSKIEHQAKTKITDLWGKIDGLRGALFQIFFLSILLQVMVLAGPFYMQLVIDQAVNSADANLLFVLAMGFLTISLLQVFISGVRRWTIAAFGMLFGFQLTRNLVHRLFRLNASYFEKRHIGDVQSRLRSLGPIRKLLTNDLITIIIDSMLSITTVFFLFAYSSTLAAIVLLVVALNALLTIVFYPFRRLRIEERIQTSANLDTYMIESIRSTNIVKIMGMEAQREGLWGNNYVEDMNARFSEAKLKIIQSSIRKSLNSASEIFIIFLGASMVISGSGFSVGMLFAFLSFKKTFMGRTISLIQKFLELKFLAIHLDRVGDIVHAEQDVGEYSDVAITKPGSIELDDVSFRYGSTSPNILEKVNLKIAPGDFVALTGPSGGGKTTLLKLLIGLYRPSSGEAVIDGNLATPALYQTWRQQVGVVMQDDRLLSGTIAQNISFFDPNMDLERVRNVAKMAKIFDEIMTMPMQFNSIIGDMTSSLSGGQKQRLLLARALYREPKVLILDEGTANLDVAVEEELAELIMELDMTKIVIAHRPALIRRATAIYHVENKEVKFRTTASDIKLAEQHSLKTENT